MSKNIKGMLAVVTGASSGIGLCFCRELASRGCRLVMISNQEELDSYARKIREEYGVETYPFFCDLTAPDAADRVAAFVDAERLEPDFLINNAGIFSFRLLEETAPERIDCFIDLHVRSVTALSLLFARRFSKRGRGRILNMSSMSCWMPMPGIAMYSATKAYIRVFSRALHYEVRDSGVTVTAACPGGIATDLFGLPEHLKRLAVNIRVLMTPERFVRKAVDRMLKGKKQYINGWLNRFSIFFVGIMPTWVRMQVKHRLLDK
ncbi:MAG: SDR family NAD(P)-dependent oxidoreductase [Muribaculaceae bacterium]|nr:SDR family NAD(P)-dependent oxidoreductase [Muribaculaceae bacterium]